MSGAALLGALNLSQPGCRSKSAEGKATAEANVQPSLFSVSADQTAHLQIVQVARTSWTVAVHTTGTVDWDQDRTTQAITQVNGPITRILVDVGTPVKKDEPLLYVSSTDVANAIAAYRKARNREQFNKRIIDRMKEMLDHGVVAQKEYESAEADYNDALTDVQNSLQPLRIFGITAQQLDAAEKQGATISTELAVAGTISYIGSFVDPNTRTTPVRIVTANPGGLLKKDMFVDAVIRTSRRDNILVVPVAAVLRDDKNEPMVYIQAAPGKYAQRSISIGAQQNGMVEVTSGLREGESVVADGSIFLQFANAIQ